MYVYCCRNKISLLSITGIMYNVQRAILERTMGRVEAIEFPVKLHVTVENMEIVSRKQVFCGHVV